MQNFRKTRTEFKIEKKTTVKANMPQHFVNEVLDLNTFQSDIKVLRYFNFYVSKTISKA